MHSCAAKQMQVHRRNTSMYGGHVSYTLKDSNDLTVSTWLRFAGEMNAMLAKTGSNRITDGWRNVGLADGDIVNSRSWSQAIETIGKHEEHRREAGTGGETDTGRSSAAKSSPKEDHAGKAKRLLGEVMREQKRRVANSAPGTTFKLREIGSPLMRAKSVIADVVNCEV